MTRGASETERLRRARRLFERAQADGVSMQEARQRLSQERWRKINDRLQAKAARGLCGTAAPEFTSDDDADAEARLQWWQR